MTATPVRFADCRGQALAGVLHGRPDGVAVVSCHGMLSSKDGTKHRLLADGLEALGVACLRFDFAGRGSSEGQLFDMTYTHEVEDLDAALQYLATNGVQRFGLFGSSMGGAVALLTAAHDERVQAVATLAAVAHPARIVERYPAEVVNWQTRGYIDTIDGKIGRGLFDDAQQHDVITAVGVLHVPVLVLHGEADEVVPVSDAHDIATAARHVTLEVVPGADHRFTNPAHLRSAISQVVTFLAEHLRQN
jgi:uncharacterized protein